MLVHSICYALRVVIGFTKLIELKIISNFDVYFWDRGIPFPFLNQSAKLKMRSRISLSNFKMQYDVLSIELYAVFAGTKIARISIGMLFL